MGIMNGLTFGGINSLDYGIYISGDAVFNAPDRSVEMLEIPGRNGEYVLDHGRFENIEVSYPAGTFGDDQTDFREKLSDFRNAILSQPGYQRLTDTYHPDEYRMGVYASGLEVSPVHYNTAGEFVLTFNCKPQRWLTSGETATSIADGGTITNPTLFDASPLLNVYGYGDIEIGDYEISIANNPQIGEIQIADGLFDSSPNNTQTVTVSQSLDVSALNTGDYISIYEQTKLSFRAEALSANLPASNLTITSTSNCTVASGILQNKVIALFPEIAPQTNAFQKGTSGSVVATCSFEWTDGGGTHSCTLTETIAYDGNATITYTRSLSNVSNITEYRNNTTVGIIMANSTKTALGNPMYIDLDIGEAWNEDYGEPVSVNNAVNLGSDLPTLPPGATTINYDNTITDLKITPRWWKV